MYSFVLSNLFYKNFSLLNSDKSCFMLFGVKDEDQIDLVSSKVIKNDMALEKNTFLTSFL